MSESAELASLLSGLQLSDSAFPSGRYTLSHGLEALVECGRLSVPSRPSTLVTLLSDSIRFGVAPSDGVALGCAHRALGAAGDADLELLASVDERLSAVKLARETREASVRTGRALLATATSALVGPTPGRPTTGGSVLGGPGLGGSALGGFGLGGSALGDYAERVADGRAPGNHAVVLGLLSASLGVPRLAAVAGELYSFSAGWVAAAVRLSLLDHRGAQAVLHRVRPVSAEAALRAQDRRVQDIGGCTPMLDVMSMRHEQAQLRLFAS